MITFVTVFVINHVCGISEIFYMSKNFYEFRDNLHFLISGFLNIFIYQCMADIYNI